MINVNRWNIAEKKMPTGEPELVMLERQVSVVLQGLLPASGILEPVNRSIQSWACERTHERMGYC